MIARAAGVVVWAALALGCARTGPWVYPGSEWNTLRAASLVVYSDADRRDIRPLVEQLAATQSALAAIFFAGQESPLIEAMVFAEHEDYQRLAGNGDSHFVPGVGATEALLVARADDATERVLRAAAHELVHRFLDAAHPHLPTWLDEGLALDLSTVRVEDGVALVGQPPAHELGLASAGTVSIEALLEPPRRQRHGPDGPGFYGGAWALVHYLRESGPERFANLLERLDDPDADPHAVLATVYPETSIPQLEQATLAMVARLRVREPAPSRRVPLTGKGAAVTLASADPEEVLALSRALGGPGLPPVRRPRPIQRTELRAELRQAFGTGVDSFALEVDRTFWGPNALEVGLGFGGEPHGQLSILLRRYAMVPGFPGILVSAAAGPSLIVKGGDVGSGGLYYLATVSPQLALGYHHKDGLTLQLEAGVDVVFVKEVGPCLRLCRSFGHLGWSLGWAW